MNESAGVGVLPLPARLLESYLSLAGQAAGEDGVAGDPALLVVWPHSTKNPFQNLLYARAKKFGFEIAPIASPDELDAISWPGPILLHIHWWSPIYNLVKNEVEAKLAGERALGEIQAFRDRTGARLLWTAHNLLPHRVPYINAARNLRRTVLETFDAVHVMHNEHRAVLENTFGVKLPATIVVPHPTYEGFYPDNVSREEARRRLGLDTTDTVFLCFGAIHQYKGIAPLIEAFQRISSDSNVRLVVAGRAADPVATERVLAFARRDPRIVFHPRHVPDEDVQIYLRAADFLVLAYEESLNSGAAWLGVTFGVPIIAPETMAFAGLSDAAQVFFFRAEVGGGVEFALREALASVSRAPARKDVPAERSPNKVSEDFFLAVRSLLKLPPQDRL